MRQIKKERDWLMLFLLVGIFVTLLFSLTHGELKVSLQDLVSALDGTASTSKKILIVDFRLPRILLACLAGGALGISGAILQSVTQNPLADTGILGINGGAGLAVLYFISEMNSGSWTDVLFPLCAFAGGGVVVAIILGLSYDKRIGFTPVRMMIIGVVISSGIYAVSLLLSSEMDAEKYRFVTLWQAGSIGSGSWTSVKILFLVLLVIFPLLVRKHRVLDILQVGNDTATSVGISIKKERIYLIGFSVALASSAVAFTGGISFLGLLSPHICRQLSFKSHSRLVPASALVGSLLLLIADTLGRLAPGVGEIPAGTVMAIIGAPYFLYLLVKKSQV